jgi:hypothetical protein
VKKKFDAFLEKQPLWIRILSRAILANVYMAAAITCGRLLSHSEKMPLDILFPLFVGFNLVLIPSVCKQEFKRVASTIHKR